MHLGPISLEKFLKIYLWLLPRVKENELNSLHQKISSLRFAKAHLFFAMLIGFVAGFGSDCWCRRSFLALALAALLVS